ncbi:MULTISPECIES: cytochrome c peroxidase [unclassified Campylobacter]|uniref:cytochrome-c peroxidase n=1 Tax=unclassified Campylobacter TaxID=2593542 RepID=UPI001BDA9984|nr:MULTISPECIES: cytochrome c peroxidase [unclassified Campylobacter]MBZ7978176.1 c-type cytochrome [Campylobacter sp. RM12654]MBZ7981475.1 c-type cytochrome [Campylobacter sp. RM12640]MBZ7989100.1 c-type cytochrome [Campylobacter sp. RM12635]MBZ7990562.1 c-type cytochrome [Campylobacter sp. RM9331]MBZ7992371.1 c-type cytochrome [Campylobacter sp. RM9333]MBZ8004799.1 c-type cytochrome [Campylobacter sp. RM9332]MBZ8007085.1 c-type cytochrome [Campylobacter sp. RM9334]
MNKIIFLIVFIVFAFADENIYKPLTSIPYDKKLAAVGKRLYFDVNLSPNKVSCNTCHNLNLTGSGTNNSGINSDNLTNPPTILNIVYSNLFFKDANITDLREQIKQTLKDDMNITPDEFNSWVKLNVTYQRWFNEIGLAANYDNLVSVLVEFEKALITLDAPFDLYLKGDKNAISDNAKRGLKLFNFYGCSSCHNGSNFGSNIIADINTSFSEGCKLEDKKVKVPTLRNITITQPYTYQGAFNNLEDIVRVMSACQLGIVMPDKDVDDIIEFLKTLEGKRPKILEEK